METFSTLLAICAGNSQRIDVFFDLHPNKQISERLEKELTQKNCYKFIQ